MFKQAIIVRKDLKMRLGKAISQINHGTSAWIKHRLKEDLRSILEDLRRPEDQQTTYMFSMSAGEKDWLFNGETKLCFKVNSEDELLNIQLKAKAKGVMCYLITDSGRTEFHNIPTHTCLAIGPADEEILKELTVGLELY